MKPKQNKFPEVFYMKISMTQISSMQKIRSCDTLPFEEIREAHVLPGERLTYQLVLQTDGRENVTLRVDSPLKEAVNLYLVKDVYMNQPAILGDMEGEDYLTLTPGMMPDVWKNNTFKSMSPDN